MPLWGASDADESKPKFLTEEQKSNTYADERGWVYRDPNTGLEEVLVAIGGLSTSLNIPDATSVRFLANTLTAGSNRTLTVEISFNEAVVVDTTGGIPTVTVANGNESGDNNGDYVLSYIVSGSTPNKLRFTKSDVTLSENDVLSFGGTGSIVLNDGTIKDAKNSAVNAALSLEETSEKTLTVRAAA